MKKQDVIEMLEKLGEGISGTFGTGCETVVHDMHERKSSVIAINNGEVTGRKVGDTANLPGTGKPISPAFREARDLINYRGHTADGKLIKTTTLHFEEETFHLSFCINFDYTNLAIAENAMRNFVTRETEAVQEDPQNPEGLLSDILDDCIKIVGKPLSVMNKSDRLQLISLLQDREAFSFQKSIPFIAKQLNISRFTIYNYLKEIKEAG